MQVPVCLGYSLGLFPNYISVFGDEVETNDWKKSTTNLPKSFFEEKVSDTSLYQRAKSILFRQNMKYLLILGDGMADEPIPELGVKTPPEVAHKPTTDRIVRAGTSATMRTVPDSQIPGSDVANMTITGSHPAHYQTGRGP